MGWGGYGGGHPSWKGLKVVETSGEEDGEASSERHCDLIRRSSSTRGSWGNAEAGAKPKIAIVQKPYNIEAT